MNNEIDGQSLDIRGEKLDQLKQLFPEFFAEGKLDLARVQQTLGDSELTTQDHYELSWAGKAEARREIQKQTPATLVPDREGSINFETSENIFIEGENLEVLRVLQKAYFGKVKIIYIDPPYNTGGDSFVYPDDYSERVQDYEKRTGQRNGDGFINKLDLFKKNTKENGQYHSVWLSMMYPRLYLARNLLKEDGMICVSIDDNEAHNLRTLMDEIFGQENFVGTITWEKRTKAQNTETAKYQFQSKTEYILLYKKQSDKVKFKLEITGTKTYPLSDEKGDYRLKVVEEMSATGMRGRQTMVFPIKGVQPRDGYQWKVGKETVEMYDSREDIDLVEGRPYMRVRPEDESAEKYSPFWSHFFDKDTYGTAETGKAELSQILGTDKHEFETVKPLALIKKLLFHATDPNNNDLVLDFFVGSGTTAQAVMEINKEDGGNRRFIVAQLAEPFEEESEAFKAGFKTVVDICRTRIRNAVKEITKSNGGKMEFAQAENDLGFRSYNLKNSNFKRWNALVSTEDELLQQLETFKEPLFKRPADSFDLLTELLLKSGVPLSATTEKRSTSDDVPYYVVEGVSIYALDSLGDELLKDIEAAQPTMFVTLGNLFTGEKADQTMTNWKLQLQEAGIDFKLI